MALGNSNSSSKSRGKNKPVAVRRIKEVRNAAGFTEFTCGPVAANSTNSCGGDVTGNTFYHDGSAALPAVNDVVYSSKRARNPNRFTAGFYKITDRGRTASLQINSLGVVLTKRNC
jgi:hypothetical protein